MDNKMFEIKLDQYKPLREIVFETIRNAIISGSLKPGERLMEVQMAERLGVSRTPIREAIRKLELEGLIIMLPRKGAYVADISVKDLTEVLEIRATLEGLAAALAVTRIKETEIEELEVIALKFHQAMETDDVEAQIILDTQFHENIFKASRNDRLIQLNSNLREQVRRFREMYLNKSDRARETIKEHTDLLEAIANRDITKAEKLAKKHVETTENAILKILEGKNA